MEIGKIPVNVLKRSVFRQIRTKREEAVSGAGIGKDCAVLQLSRGSGLAACIQEAAVEIPDAAWREQNAEEPVCTLADLIQKCANNLAAGGGLPAAVMVALLLPEGTEEAAIKALMAQAEEKCQEMSMQIVGGQTRISKAAALPMAVVTGYGSVPEEDCRKERTALPGQDVIVSKWIGLQGTAVIAKRNRTRLLNRYPAYLVEEAMGFGRYLSILPEALLAGKAGVGAMHDASEGGIFGALWELAEGAGVGLEIDMRKLPIRQETVEVCEYCNVNPYELLCGGCLIMTAADGPGLVRILEREHIPARVVGRVTEGKGRILVNGEEIRYMDRPQRDSIYKSNSIRLENTMHGSGRADAERE